MKTIKLVTRSSVKIIIVSILALFVSGNMVFAQDTYQFMNLSWTDTPEIMSSKLVASGDFGKPDKHENQLELSDLIDEPIYEELPMLKQAQELFKQCDFESIAKYKSWLEMSVDMNTVPLRTVTGYFSMKSKKLMYYEVEIDDKKRDTVLKKLQDKYGEGNQIVHENSQQFWQIWSKGDEVLVIEKGQSLEPIFYLNMAHIKEGAEACLATKKEAAESEVKKTKNVF